MCIREGVAYVLARADEPYKEVMALTESMLLMNGTDRGILMEGFFHVQSI
jgi:hypothetical protein